MTPPAAAPEQGALFDAEPRLVRRTRRDSDRTIRELRRLGRIEPVQVGIVAMLRTLADLIDAELGKPDRSAWVIARLVAEWRAVHAELRGEAASGWDAQLTAFFSAEEGPADDRGAAVRDTSQL